MNVIFLDVDGVLNSTRKLIEVYNLTKKPHSCYNYPFDELCLENFKSLVLETDSKIIVTSTWRKDKEGRDRLLLELSKYGLEDRVIGYTEVLHDREEEIKRSLQLLGDVNFIILDDDAKFDDLFEFVVKTDNMVGLSSENKDLGIRKMLHRKSTND